MKRVAIVGGGIAGLTAAWQLHRLGQASTLYEAGHRLGGTVETIRRDNFIVELGPDGWVTEKPAATELALDLGLADQLIHSNDATRVTYILSGGRLEAMPDGMRMMVPTDLAALEHSPLFSAAARRAYAAEPGRARELLANAPQTDESVAAFVRRHFGEEVLNKLAAPLLSGVFGGDVANLSVQAVMPAFVQMEREHGSLIRALQARAGRSQQPVFTTLSSGVATLTDRMSAELPSTSIRLETPVTRLSRTVPEWLLDTTDGPQAFDAVMLALPAHLARSLLEPLSSRMAVLLEMDATSAILVSFAFEGPFALPQGFGFLVPPSEPNALLACTFVDQKFSHRTPAHSRLIRAFFGGHQAPAISPQSDEAIAALALTELQKILGSLPQPVFHLVRRWPRSLPQYAVGHLHRIAELETLARQHPNLWLLGNAYRGVGLPDLIGAARAAARELMAR